MQRLEVSGAVRPIYGSLGVKRLTSCNPEVLFRTIPGLLYLYQTTWRCVLQLKMFTPKSRVYLQNYMT